MAREFAKKQPPAKAPAQPTAASTGALQSTEPVNPIWERLSLRALLSPPASTPPIQLKEEVGSASSPQEDEADRVACRIVPGGGPPARRATPGTQEARGEQAAGPSVEPNLERVLQEPGEPLDPTARAFMERRLHHSFADVRVQTGNEAAALAARLSAHAFTIGERIAFAEGRYSPHTTSGRWLLAHELSHVIQQSGARSGRRPEPHTAAADVPHGDATPTPGRSPRSIQRAFDNTYHRIAADITSAFEGGRPDTLQTSDRGIISYGMHQATLRSDTLYNVLTRYLQLSQTPTAQAMRPFMSRVQQHDESLRTDQPFLQLLRQAATEPEMARAQHEVFSQSIWGPAVVAAHREQLNSAIGFAMFYDTNIQGGLTTLIQRTRQRLGGGIGSTVAGRTITEREYLLTFNQEREARLINLAATNDATAQAAALEAAAALSRGDSAAATEATNRQREAASTANYQRTSVYRTQSFLALLNAGNMELRGGVNAHGHMVAGLTPGATIDDPEATPILQQGMRGPEVAELQRLLNAHGANPTLPITGNFGPGTRAAVIAYQGAQSPALTADGIVNQATWAALRAVTQPAPAQTVAPPQTVTTTPPAPPQVVTPPAPSQDAAPPQTVTTPAPPQDAATPQDVTPPASTQDVAPPQPVTTPPAPPRTVAPPQTVTPPVPPWNAAPAPPTTPILQQGALGPDVAELQRLLNTHGASPPLPTNGRFGPATFAMVVAFQSSRTPPLPANGIVDAPTWRALRLAPAQGVRAPAATVTIPPAIARLDLLPKATRAALTLWQQNPAVVFTSGRRTLEDQARAMAQNIVGRGGRNWIAATYRPGPATRLQDWVTQHPQALTQAEVERGLISVLRTMPLHEQVGVSRHLSGEAFDVQPNSIDVRLIRALPELTQFLEREGNLVRWHVYIRE